MAERYGKSKTALGRTYLKEWRSLRGLTQEQLAEAIQSTHVTVSRMERGERPYNQPFLEACADALDCSPADLLAGPPNRISALNKIFKSLKNKSTDQIEKIARIVEIMD